jgi:probable phosphoglycerate mutase
LEVRTDPRLMEVNVGLFQDRLRSEIESLYPKELAAWLSGDPDVRLPGGESRSDLARRGCEALADIARAGHAHTVVVAHGGILVTVVKTLLGIPLRDPPLALENGSITRFRWDGAGRPELLAVNEVEHLQSIGLGGIGDLAV